MRERLQKILAAAAVASRRQCEELILQGVVKVNGKRVDTLPAFADPQEDVITVKGREIRRIEKSYFLVNKPKGVVCTESATGRKRVIDLVPVRERMFCIGSMEPEATGAVILTSDSEMAARLTNRKYDLEKTYVVHIKGRMTDEAIGKLKKGVWLAEAKAVARSLKIMKISSVETVIEMVVGGEVHRQIRRMVAKAGHEVKSLTRIGIGTMRLGRVNVGECRKLGKPEIAQLRKTADL